MRRITRVIRIGSTVVSARVCEICPQQPAIFPQELFERHLANHAAPSATDSRAQVGLRPVNRYRGGRTIGVKNQQSQSLKRESIRAK